MRNQWIGALLGLGLFAFCLLPGVTADEKKEPTGAVLDRNVTLQFQIGGDTATITTADSVFSISTLGHRQSTDSRAEAEGGVEESSEYTIELSGTVSITPRADQVMVTCVGSFSTARVSSQSVNGGHIAELSKLACAIDASAYVTPNKPVLIARSGGDSLEMTYLDGD